MSKLRAGVGGATAAEARSGWGTFSVVRGRERGSDRQS